MRYTHPLPVALALAAMALASPGRAQGQHLWSDRSSDRAIQLEIVRPELADEGPMKFPSTAWFLSYRHRLSESVLLVGELPIAYGRMEGRSVLVDTDFDGVPDALGGPSVSATRAGNPYLGVEIGRRSSRGFVELGVRAPIAAAESDEEELALLVGLLSDIDRWEAFLPDVVPVTALGNYRYVGASGFGIRVRAGPSAWLATESEQDSELFAMYAIQAFYEGPRASLGAAVSGRAILSESDLDLAERTIHQLGLDAAVNLGRVRPGARILVPVDDDLNDFVDFSLELHIAVAMP